MNYCQENVSWKPIISLHLIKSLVRYLFSSQHNEKRDYVANELYLYTKLVSILYDYQFRTTAFITIENEYQFKIIQK